MITTDITTDRTTSRRALRRILVAVMAAVVTLVGLGATQASAFTRTTLSGAPGYTVATQVVGSHLQVACGAPGYYNCFAPGLRIGGPLVYRSPLTSGAQTVYVVTTVYRWSNGWYVETQRSQAGTIAAGQSAVRFGQWDVLTTVGHKYVKFGVIWADAYGRPLASQAVTMNTAGDYTCQTRFAYACSANAGYVSIWRQ